MNGACQVESDFVFGSWLLSNGSVRFQERVNPRSGGPSSRFSFARRPTFARSIHAAKNKIRIKATLDSRLVVETFRFENEFEI